MKYVEIYQNGLIKTFKGDFPELKLYCKTEKRVSHILPENFILRLFFKILRKIFGDEGFIANWTRKWKCNWIIILNKQKIGGVFKDRKLAIEFEKKFVIENLLKKEGGEI